MAEWRAVVGFEGRYEVSEDGEVRNARTGRALKPGRCTNGYMMVHLGRGSTQRVHRVVAGAFVANPDRKPEVNHRNGVKSDNQAANLEWTTHSENHLHAHHTIPRKRHARQRGVVVSGAVVSGRFASVSAAAVALGVGDGNAAAAARGGYKCKGHTIQYA